MPSAALARRLARLLPLTVCLVGSLAWTLRSTPDDDVANLIQAVADGRKKLARDRFDPAVVVAQAEADPAKLHAWVRTHTRQVAYPGTLRGALGVLMDRTGNSLDRALLLGQLLVLAGYEARIVRAPLPEDEARAITADAGDRATDAGSVVDDTDVYAKAAAPIAAMLATTLKAQLDALPPLVPAVEPEHAWVQYQDASGWVDLDPTLAEAGKRRLEPRGEPLAVDCARTDAATYAKLAQAVNLELFVERWEAGKLHESLLLMVPFDARANPLASATLTFVPVNKKTGRASGRDAATGARMRQVLPKETAWTPMLADGKNGGRMARMFDDRGVVGDRPKAFSGAEELGNAGRDVFGGLGGGGGEEGEPASVLTALAADYVLRTPGQPPRRVRRYVFDSLGAGAREQSRHEDLPRPQWSDDDKIERGTHLAAVEDTLVTFASLPPEAYVDRFAQRVVDSKAATLRAAGGAEDTPTLEVAADGASFRTLELFAAARDQHLPPALAVAEPQVFRRIIRPITHPTTDADEHELDLEVVSDLVWNRLAPATAAATRQTAIAQGVLDTLQEAIVVFRATPARPGDATAALFAEAKAQGVETIVVSTADDPHLAAMPPATRARLRDDLAAGQVAVLPARPVTVDGAPRLGWWRVDPRTGQTIGAMDTGLLQDYVEYTETQEVNGVRITHFRRVRVPPEARQWAEHVIRQRGFTSWDQWLNLLRYATRAMADGRFAMI